METRTFTVIAAPEWPQADLRPDYQALAIEGGVISGFRGHHWSEQLVLMTRWAQSTTWSSMLLKGGGFFRIESADEAGPLVALPERANLALLFKDGSKQAALCDESEGRFGDTLALLRKDGRWEYDDQGAPSGSRLVIGSSYYYERLLNPPAKPLGRRSRPSVLAEPQLA